MATLAETISGVPLRIATQIARQRPFLSVDDEPIDSNCDLPRRPGMSRDEIDADRAGSRVRGEI